MNSTASAFLLKNKVNGKHFKVVPGYTPEELNQKIPVVYKCGDGNGGVKDCRIDENPNILRHAVVMGNSMIAGKDDSFVVGLPYTWVGESFGSAFQDNNERRIGTIGRVNFDERLGPSLTLPKNQEYSDVIGLASQGGSIWASKMSSRSSEKDPVRNLYAGTSIAKGIHF